MRYIFVYNIIRYYKYYGTIDSTTLQLLYWLNNYSTAQLVLLPCSPVDLMDFLSGAGRHPQGKVKEILKAYRSVQKEPISLTKFY